MYCSMLQYDVVRYSVLHLKYGHFFINMYIYVYVLHCINVYAYICI